MSFSISPALNGYDTPRTIALADQLRARVAALPGVRAVGSAEIGALTGTDEGTNITTEGGAQLPEDQQHVNYVAVSADYFSTLGAPLIQGREFALVDGTSSPKVAVASETMVKRFFPGRNPVGMHFAFGGGDKVKPDIEIVGVVKDMKQDHVKTITPAFKAPSDWRGDDEHTAKLREGMAPDPAGGFLVTEKGHAGVATRRPGKFPFMGNVFVLIDGGTFSTAADFCAVTHHLKRATFIGEETGGGYYGNNSGLSAALTLPHSKLKVRVQMYEYWNAVPGYEGTRRGTIPDYPVEFRTADLLRGVDAPLELARKLAKADAK